MKALVISDLHANIYALEAIWNREKDSDIIYCAGDLVDAGPHPKEIIEWIRAHNAVCVKGNHDETVISIFRYNESNATPAVIRNWAQINAKKLNVDDILFLENIPYTVTFEMDSIGYIMQHMYGNNYGTINTLFHFDQFWEKQTQSPINAMAYKRLIFGHTHYQGVYYLSNEKLWINPGSCSYRANRYRGAEYAPDEPSIEAHYITITDGLIDLKRVAYDLSPLIADTLKEGLDKEALYILK